MKSSCKYCGRYHDKLFDCGKKPIRNYKKTYSSDEYKDADKFRKRQVWIKKSKQIRQRDKGLCVICIRNLYNTIHRYSFDDVSTHHIVPLHEDMSKGLDDYNLITLCRMHHEMAERGNIPRAEQRAIAKEQEQAWLL